MAVTEEIAWGDGSGDKIYLTADALEGNQTILVSSDANAGYTDRTKVVTFSAPGVTPISLTVTQSAGSLPYTPLNYIQTDGTAYINTGIAGTPPRSAEIECTPVSASAAMTILGSRGSTSTSEGKKFMMFRQSSANLLGFSYYTNYTSGMPSIVSSVNNTTPFVAKVVMRKGYQITAVKQQGESSFTQVSKSNNNTVSSTLNMFLFAVNNNGTASEKMASGTRIHYCKIYNDDSMANLVFDGVPCVYNGAYGLWDKVSNSFFGNVAGSGSFSGA